ncbi:MAG: hypothetical protein NTZ59_15300 [Bacteroidetes bacterium]|nr:hypothetical protein [Bacteroidota bacterium]
MIGKYIMAYRKKKRLYKSIANGLQQLNATGKTSEQSYYDMRELFVLTSGKSNDVVSSKISQPKHQNIDWQNGVLNLKNKQDFDRAITGIRRDGYFVFDAKLSEDVVNKIVDFAKTTPCKYRKISENSTGTDYKIDVVNGEALFDETHIESPLYQFTMDKIIVSKEIQKLVFDTSLLAFAQEYLNTKPIVDLLAMWWSVPFAGKGKSEAAQMYHFDLDRLKFMKFFFYLTDVDGETGPHCYVRGSHKKLHPTLQRDGRFTDEEVEVAFGKENLMELGGKRGTIMAVDTRGLHKGKDLTKDKRLIFQIEFANSMFGQVYPPFKKPDFDIEEEATYNKYEFTYSQIMSK